jgi:hypothetical protein
MSGSEIVTGVDRLMELIKEKKRLSVDDAAKCIGVSRAIIEEWADFLEEERIINLAHKFTHTEMVFRAMPKVHVRTGHRQVMKINDVKNLDEVEKNIDLFKKEMHKQLDLIKHNMKNYNQEKFRLINKKISTFDEDLKNKVNSIKKELQVEKKEIAIERNDIISLQKQKEQIQKRISLIEQLIYDKKKLPMHKSLKTTHRKQNISSKAKSIQKEAIREKIRKLNKIKAKTLVNQNHFGKESFDKQIQTIESLLNDYMTKLMEL